MGQNQFLKSIKKVISKYQILVLLLLLLFSLVFIYSSQSDQGKKQEVTQVSRQGEEDVAGLVTTRNFQEGKEELSVTLKVNNGSSVNEYEVKVPPEATVYQVLELASSEYGFTLQAKDYGSEMGMFIEEIAGVPNNSSSNSYWVYYINGNSAEKGASLVKVKKSDVIEWRY